MIFTLNQIRTLLDTDKVRLLDVEERFKDVLDVWIKIGSEEYRVILKDTTLEDFFRVIPHPLMLDRI
jgi:hypothetical protein